MFLTERKLDRRITEIKEYCYREIKNIEKFAMCEDRQGVVNPAVPVDFDGWDYIHTGECWSGRDRYLWLHTEIFIPQNWKGKRAVGIFDFGNTGGGNNSGFEAMCYLNEKPYQGVDANHKEVFFPEECYGKKVSLTFRLWSGLEGGGVPKEQEHRIKRADLAYLDEKTDDFYYLGMLMLDTIQCLDQTDPVKYQLRNALDEACLLIDWSYPGSDEFYDSVYEADIFLNEKVDGMEKHSQVKVKCVGHTHIDMAWLWRLKHTREKASRSFSTVLRMMEMFPEYIFLQTQPQLYEYIKKDFPEIYEEIKKRVKEGRWEVDGGMWVEADCNLTSGESLTRQILLGSKFLKDEFGKEVEYLWLPDVFGYSWALPQILKKSGIDMFMTTKISWNQFNRMPHDTFIWKGMDGSQVLTHFITTPEPWSDPGSWFYTYNGLLTAKTVKGVWDAYSEKEMNQELLISYGYGDGGGGVNRDLLERRRRINKIPGLPSLETSTAGEYFRKLKETVRNTNRYVHTWDGELYLEYHRGTYTSQGYNKRMNRKMELLYRNAEWMTAMGALKNGNLKLAQQEELTKGWKRILTNQFHDIIPGSSIHEVYEDSRRDYVEIKQIADKVIEGYQKEFLVGEKQGYTVYNSSGWNLDEIISLPVEKTGSFTDSNGRRLQTQTEKGKTYIQLRKVPPMGHETIYYQETEKLPEESAFSIYEKEIETPYYSVRLNSKGQIERLYDKENKREVLTPGERGNVLQVFEDKPLDYDAWDIDIFYQQKMREVEELTEFEVKECGSIRMVLKLTWKFHNTTIWQEMILYSTKPQIDFHTKVDFQERQQLLKVAFPVDVRTTYATYDIQYGNVRRPNHWNTSWDQARFESVGHRFADLSERNYGVALLNDCKYGYDVKENVLRLSLLRSGKHPDYLQDLGYHEFTYELLPHAKDFVDGGVVQAAHQLNNPMLITEGTEQTPNESLFTLDNCQIEIDAVKKSEDGRYLVIRFHDFAGSRQRVTLEPNFHFKSWAEGDLRERITEQKTEKEVFLELHPYEIKTLLFQI